MRYYKKMPGQRLYLSPMNPDDAEVYAQWMNDPEITGFLGNRGHIISLDSERKWIEENAAMGCNFSIVLNEGDRLIGNISLMQIDNLNRRATLGIFIGDAEYHSKGYGAEAIRLILDYGFNWLNLKNIDLTVHADNERGIACYKKVGFREYGRRTDACFKGGKYVDEVHMEILDRDFGVR